MPQKPNDIVYAKISAVTDNKTNKQVEDDKGRKKWLIEATLPKHYDSKQKRPRRYRNFYGSERQASREKDNFVEELKEELSKRFISSLIPQNLSKVSFGEHLRSWLEIKQHCLFGL